MNIDSNTPRVPRTIAGLQVQVPAPYAEGHVVTAGEAQMLNQTLAENFSNNLRKRAEAYVPDGAPEGTEARPATAEELQSLVDAYAATYEPGVRQGGGGGRAGLTPLQKEINDLARQKVREFLKSRGQKQSDVDFKAIVAKLIETKGDQLEAAAQRVLAAKQKAAGATGDELGIDSLV